MEKSTSSTVNRASTNCSNINDSIHQENSKEIQGTVASRPVHLNTSADQAGSTIHPTGNKGRPRGRPRKTVPTNQTDPMPKSPVHHRLSATNTKIRRLLQGNTGTELSLNDGVELRHRGMQQSTTIEQPQLPNNTIEASQSPPRHPLAEIHNSPSVLAKRRIGRPRKAPVVDPIAASSSKKRRLISNDENMEPTTPTFPSRPDDLASNQEMYNVINVQPWQRIGNGQATSGCSNTPTMNETMLPGLSTGDGPSVIPQSCVTGTRHAFEVSRKYRRTNCGTPDTNLPIMMLDFDSADPSHEQSARRQETSDNHSTLYDKYESHDALTIGIPTHLCRHCRALCWFEERAVKSTRPINPEFSICCMKGQVDIPLLKEPPQLLLNLIRGQDHRSRNWRENTRAYNSMFAFTSMGGRVVTTTNNGGSPPQFILHGQNYHRIGSLVPTEGSVPKYAQLYIWDTRNEVENRMSHFRPTGTSNVIDETLVRDLKQMVDQYNVIAKKYREVRDLQEQNPAVKISLRLIKDRSSNPRTHNTPTCDEVAALIIGDDDQLERGRDIIVKHMSGDLERVNETHTALLPLQYPLIFSRGEDGFRENTPLRQMGGRNRSEKRQTLTLREFIAFRIQEREVEFGLIVGARRLFQQFVVDCYTMLESTRLKFIRHNQQLIRSEILSGLQDAVTRGENDASSIGRRVILPPSFTGGARYMFNKCQDAMAICKRFGYPDLFITITCNANWPEIVDFVRPRGLTAADRPDIISRVFKMKLDQLITDLKKDKMFGKVDAVMYTVEWQKRGLPHAHLLLWLSGENKLKTTRDIDKIISAELPDPNLYPNLYQAVSSYMIHGPCGVANPKATCTKGTFCTKFYPRPFLQATKIDEDGYPCYKRHNTGVTVEKGGNIFDNRFVVPYNPQLLMRYRGHVNVEYCNKSNSIKYLFKYVNKGPDRATLQVLRSSDNPDAPVDEIRNFYQCRYVSPSEAVWRIFAFDIHMKWPPVQKLTFHLQGEQTVLFDDDANIEDVIWRAENYDTQFLAWFAANRTYTEGRDLTYAEFPSRFVYNPQDRVWVPRKKGDSLGRINYVPPGIGEKYFLRILLNHQRGCTSYESLRKVNGKVEPTFEDACFKLKLLGGDREFIDAINEGAKLLSGPQLRRLFANLLATNSMNRPSNVWETTWQVLADGIVFNVRRQLQRPGLQIPRDQLRNTCLVEIEKLLQLNGRSLHDYSMPYPDIDEGHDFQNKLIADELNYDKDQMRRQYESLEKNLNDDQRKACDEITTSVISGRGGFFLLCGFGGTGKTYCWSTETALLRSMGYIVLNTASSGIAALLLPGGKTAHSTFGIPLVPKDESTCNVSQSSPRAQLLREAKLIIWDEAPMLHRNCFEALDRTLKDIMSTVDRANMNKPFGGKTVVLGGDFRQILPVVKKGTRHQILAASVNSSKIWSSCKVLNLTQNMRLGSSNIEAERVEIKEFADWLLKIGDGQGQANEHGEIDVDIPEDLLILDPINPLQSLINFAYPNLLDNLQTAGFFEERAILAPTLDTVAHVNEYVLSQIPGEIVEYLSSDTVCQSDEDSEVHSEWFTPEFLNDIKCSGIPNHKLLLKVGVPIMLMRNIDQSAGLSNGTRLMVDHLGTHIITATVLTGKNIGDKILIPRMNLIPSDAGLPFKFQRRQFPVTVCFAMTINKSQGQSLSHVGIYLPKPVFTHGQLYVALSRVKSRRGLKLLILDEDNNVLRSTKNVVYNEVFDNI